jgi:hypothetical protein
VTAAGRTWVVLVVAAAMAPAADRDLAAQPAGVYRTLTVQAAPGDLLELIELYREERQILADLGEEPPLWMRHSQGDIWDLLLLYPVGDLSEHFDVARTRRVAEATTRTGLSGAELQREIDARTAWREEVFVRGPAVEEVKGAWSEAGYFHVEMFEGLAGKRAELIREREMENDYLVRLDRKPNHIFTRIAGSSTDAFTVGYYRDLKAYANPPDVTPEQEDAAAKAAGFRGAAYIGAYLRELILRHHDTLAVPIP